jgi:hypothetical protein
MPPFSFSVLVYADTMPSLSGETENETALVPFPAIQAIQKTSAVDRAIHRNNP